MRKEISFELYLVYPVPTSGAIAKGHETPNPNKQEASNPLKNPKKAFPSVISHAHYQPLPQEMGVGRVIAPLDDLNDDIFKTIL